MYFIRIVMVLQLHDQLSNFLSVRRVTNLNNNFSKIENFDSDSTTMNIVNIIKSIFQHASIVQLTVVGKTINIHSLLLKKHAY